MAGIAYRCLVLAMLAVGCRAGEGDRCVCADDCKSGLVCAVQGDLLGEGECSPGGSALGGMCVPDDGMSQATTGPLTTGFYMDLGSKVDFEPNPGTATMTTGTTQSGTMGETSTATGTSTGDPSTTGSTTDTDTTGSTSDTTSGATGSGATGSGATGSGATGSGATGTDASGSSADSGTATQTSGTT